VLLFHSWSVCALCTQVGETLIDEVKRLTAKVGKLEEDIKALQTDLAHKTIEFEARLQQVEEVKETLSSPMLPSSSSPSSSST